MAVEHIHSYLVHPGKGVGDPQRIGGTSLPLTGKLFKLLNDIYTRSDSECNIDISFNQAADGTQQNSCRDLIITYLNGPTVPRGRHIAERLGKVTTNRSGLGLLFLITGQEGQHHKIVISRFPADNGILAEENQQNLNVEFLERVFMKRATAYKAVVYHDASLSTGFWTGRAIDKQLNSDLVQLSNYWIAEFLDSDFRTTSASGTKRLAIALRDAMKTVEDINVKTEIAAAATLASNLGRRRLSIRDLENQFNLSDAAKQAIANEIKVPSVIAEQFQFDPSEFSKHVAYRSIKMDSGAVLSAEAANFDQIFQRESLDGVDQQVRIWTDGKVVSEKVGKS